VTLSGRPSSRLLIVLATAAYAGVFVAFVLFEKPGLGFGHFFYIPVCLVALATDELWGAAAGVLATGLFAAAVALTPDVPTAHLLTVSTGIRFLTYAGVGAVVGGYASSNRRLVGRLVENATHDFLTGVGNARAFDEWLARRCESGRPFTLVLGDMDNLKSINDVHGHAAGNDTLRRVAAVFREHADADDEVARIGGDEFAILTSLPAEEAALFTARLAHSLAAEELYLSFGATSAPTDGTTAVELFRKADDRLFAAKLVSRNRRTVLSLAGG
jgi:diguanylate cyclase (GGDEF)-like protein